MVAARVATKLTLPNFFKLFFVDFNQYIIVCVCSLLPLFEGCYSRRSRTTTTQLQLPWPLVDALFFSFVCIRAIERLWQLWAKAIYTHKKRRERKNDTFIQWVRFSSKPLVFHIHYFPCLKQQLQHASLIFAHFSFLASSKAPTI